MPYYQGEPSYDQLLEMALAERRRRGAPSEDPRTRSLEERALERRYGGARSADEDMILAAPAGRWLLRQLLTLIGYSQADKFDEMVEEKLKPKNAPPGADQAEPLALRPSDAVGIAIARVLRWKPKILGPLSLRFAQRTGILSPGEALAQEAFGDGRHVLLAHEGLTDAAGRPLRQAVQEKAAATATGKKAKTSPKTVTIWGADNSPLSTVRVRSDPASMVLAIPRP
jgi:hypothetical protein